MNENESIITGLEDSLATIGVLRTRIGLVRSRMITGISNPENHIVTFDINAMEAALYALRTQEEILSGLLIEYKARQD